MPVVEPGGPRVAENLGARTKAHVRYYLSDGSQVPGVTTVVDLLSKPALARWSNQLGLEGVEMGKYLDETAHIGTLTHYVISCGLRGETPQLDSYTVEQVQRAEPSCQAWDRWRRDRAIRPLLVEQQLVSERFGFGGTVDLVAEVDDTVTLLDVKTGREIYDHHRIQVAAYVALAAENGHRVDDARVLRLGRADGGGITEEVLTREELVRWWLVFRRLLAVWYLRKEVRR